MKTIVPTIIPFPQGNESTEGLHDEINLVNDEKESNIVNIRSNIDEPQTSNGIGTHTSTESNQIEMTVTKLNLSALKSRSYLETLATRNFPASFINQIDNVLNNLEQRELEKEKNLSILKKVFDQSKIVKQYLHNVNEKFTFMFRIRPKNCNDQDTNYE